MTERTKGKRPDYKKLASTGELILKTSEVRKRHEVRRTVSEVNNVTQFFECLNINSADMEEDLHNTDNQLGASGGVDTPINTAITRPPPPAEATGGGAGDVSDDGISKEEAVRRRKHSEDQKQQLLQLLKAEEEERHLRERLQAEKEERLQWTLRMKDGRQAEAQLDFERSQIAHQKDQLVSQLISQAESLSDDIEDFIEENPSKEFGNSIEDLDKIISRVEEMRSSFRGRHKELQLHCREHYSESLGRACATTLDDVKEYVREARNRRKSLRDGEDTEKIALLMVKEKKLKFLGTEVRRTISDLYVIFSAVLDNESDEGITKRKEDLSDLFKIVQTIPKKIEEIMDAGEDDSEINRIKSRYDSLLDAKSLYITRLENAAKDREIEKQKSFKTASLNIQLSKFKGYSSSLDIYTFQDQFEKIHLKITPTSCLPDVLKNNFLEGPALACVKNVTEIAEIWSRLKDAYGDSKIMLSKKLAELNNMEQTWKSKDPTKTIESVSKIINLMKDLLQLSKRHNIQNNLFYGDGLERIYRLLGEGRINRWLSQRDEGKECEDLWLALIAFLEKELKICHQKVVIFQKSKDPKDKDSPSSKKTYHSGGSQGNNSNPPPTPPESVTVCAICGEPDHVQTTGPAGIKLVQYFVCKKWAEMSNQDRFNILKEKGLCYQCLFPGAERKGKHATGRCQRDFTCKHPSHERFPTKKHVLVCEEHKTMFENQDLLQKFKTRCILRQHQTELPAHAKEISLSHYVKSPTKQLPDVSNNGGSDSAHVPEDTPDAEAPTPDAEAPTDQSASYVNDQPDQSSPFVDSVQDNSVYMLQTIQVGEHTYSLFYDSGCGDFVSRHNAVQRLGSRAVQLMNGPLTLTGVGDIKTQARHGIYGVRLPLAEGGEASMAGRCMDTITETFPAYPLNGKIEEDIRRGFHEQKGNLKKLPMLPPFSGGDTDFMIGSKYRKYFPKEEFQLPSGLSICRSHFKNVDGSRGVICGPHEVISLIDQTHHHHATSFMASQRQLFRFGYQVNPDIKLLGFKDDGDDSTDEETEGTSINHYYAPRRLKKFNEAEMAGSEITYRCITCRSCTDCKNHDHVEALSIKEEVEQDLISRTVHVDTEKCETTASLPLLGDPAVKLAPNRHKAQKTYDQQMKHLGRNPEDKEALIKSEDKLQQLGFVEWVKDLPEDTQKMLRESDVQNFIPWRVVFKENSTTTPCRMVFDGSQPTDSGYCLNDLVPKGINMLNKLVEIFLRWRIYPEAFHCDVQKMYNAIRLSEEFWCLQRYLFQKDLDPSLPTEEKVIKTLIYGIRSSGNQAQCGLRKTAELFKDQYPDVNEIVSKDTYMDDCLSGGRTVEESNQRQDDLQLVLGFGGYTLKGFTVTGQDPEEALTSDGVSVSVSGHKWFPREDLLSLDMKELNFAKKRRGKKAESIKDVPKNLTKRHCASKAGEIFDFTGIVTPLVAGIKMDLHELNVRKLDWDDVLPNDLQQIWKSHFEMMTEIKELKYRRAVVPEDAVDLNVTTLDYGDASRSLVCVAIYARFKRKNGKFSCQLIFARSRLVPDGMTQPRAELYAALVNAHAGEVVRRALSNFHQHALKFTDSQIVLYWICKNDQILKQWARNRIIEIQRVADISLWRGVKSEDMIADIGTRKCSSTDVAKPDSVWIRGFPHMQEEEENLPMMTCEEITLNNQEFQNMKKEVQENIFKLAYIATSTKDSKSKAFNEDLLNRYQFSKYLIDPNHRRFTVVMRIQSHVFRFINILKQRVQNRRIGRPNRSEQAEVPPLTEEEINDTKMYFFRKATLEVKNFLKASQYKDISQEMDGVLTYTGRILPTDRVSIVGRATQVMKDLTSTMFCVPLVEKNSPLAYSIVSDVHWNHPTANHCGVETVWRYVLQHAFIIEGKSVVMKIGKSCERCRYLNKKMFEISMGPVSPHNLNIAPAFYVTQTDLAGPFSAHCHHHKRNTIKVWFVVFCCATTSTTNIKVMEDYSTTAFLQAFARFSSEVGYPKTLLCDEGSQLVKGCESMNLKFSDLKSKLHQENGVDFDLCPVGGHNMNGRVERKIREVKKSISKSVSNNRLSIMQWETLAATISNTINNMPLALGNTKSNIEALDLLTPNRLKMGRNNERSPDGCVTVAHPDKILEENEKIFNSWFEVWLSAHVPKLVDQPKWFKSDENLKPGDVVLFLKQESVLSSNYQYGMVDEVETGRDGKVRKASIRYRNHNESVNRLTYRSVRGLVVIHRVDETNVMEELGQVARFIEIERGSNVVNHKFPTVGGV